MTRADDRGRGHARSIERFGVGPDGLAATRAREEIRPMSRSWTGSC
jgi:hypothetical protein